MGQYSTGTVTVTQGNNQVQGSAEVDWSFVMPGDLFTKTGTTPIYTVGACNPTTKVITLVENYAGVSEAGIAYEISWEFSPINNIPLPSPGDTNAVAVIRRALLTIDAFNLDIPAAIHAATSKTTPVDADEFGGADSAAAFGLFRTSWANIKATLALQFAALAGLATQVFSVAAATAAAHAVRADQVQGQSLTAFTTGGTATAYTLTPAPAIAANTAGIMLHATFHTAAGATPTMAVSGKTPLALKFKNTAGVKQAVTIDQVPSGWTSDVECDGTDWMVLSVANQLNCKFLAYLSATQADVTGDATVYSLICNTEVYDTALSYNNATGVFTAPITKEYNFSVIVALEQLTIGTHIPDIQLITTQKTVILQENKASAATQVFQISPPPLKMDAGDTAYISVRVQSGTKVVDITGHATVLYTCFGGEISR